MAECIKKNSKKGLNMKYVKFDDLYNFMINCLIKHNVPPRDAKIISEVLITADKRGIDSHGIGRLKPIYLDRIKEGIINPKTRITTIKNRGATCILDGNNGFGHVVSYKAMEIALKKANKYGIAMVAVKNSTHYGIAGYYALMAVNKGMIGITGTNARPSIAPTFGVENMLGTNPLTFGIPSNDDYPFILDCATSISQRGKIEVYARENKALPENWVIGRDGKSHTDSKAVLLELTENKAALTPLGGIGEEGGGYKGYGYATVVEILSAGLQDGDFLKDLSGIDKNGNPVPYHLGHFFIVINPDFFMGKIILKKITSEILKNLRESEKAPGNQRIYTAGEKEWEAYKERSDKGCPINESLEQVISQLSTILNIDNPLSK
jgi:L-2-hydroxycarboxylate dehydrogenase (NAD+)